MSDGNALPPRDPETLLHSGFARALTYLVVGATGGALGAVLMAMDEGIEGHGHGGGGSPFAMLAHQLLLTLPLVLLVILVAREAEAKRMAGALGLSLAGVLAVDLLLS